MNEIKTGVWDRITAYADRTKSDEFSTADVFGLTGATDEEMQIVRQLAANGFISISEDVTGYSIQVLKR